MSLSTRRTALALLGSSALVACATPQIVSRDTPDPFEGGIGGTGIVGVLTDFGSLIVNGLKVEVTTGTRVFDTFGEVSANALAPGQSLTIYATRDRDAIVARRVQIDHAVIGTIEQTNTGARINGIPLEAEQNAPVRLQAGQRVAVSGIWASDRLIVSRVDPVSAGPDVVAGTLMRSSDGNALSIGDAILRGETQANQPGQYTTVFGSGNGSGIDVDRLETGRFKGVTDLRQLSVEGFLEPTRTNPGYRVAGLGHSFARDLRLAPLDGQRAVYFGRYNGLFRAQLGFVLPQDFAARRALLRQGYENGFEGQILRL